MQIQLITVPYRYDEPRKGLGLGPGALLAAGLEQRLSASGHTLVGVVESHLPPSEREEGRTAVNIGKLGACTAQLVTAGRRAGYAPLVLAGDDTAAVGVVAGLQQSDGDAPLGVVWLDAHGDFNTPETSFSGILAGMPLAIIAGHAGPLWRNAARMKAPVPADRIVIAGVRDLDDKEEELLRSTSVRVVRAAELRVGESFQDEVRRLADACSLLSMHVDLDVLDPHLVPSSSTPSAGGLELSEAAAAMAAVLRTGKVAAVCVSSLNPGGGQRGNRSVASALALLEQALLEWTALPPRNATC
jgi:arginase